MTASKHEKDAPGKLADAQKSKRKAVTSPKPVGSSTRAKTRQGIVKEGDRLQKGSDLQEVNYIKDLEGNLDEELAANDLELATTIVSNLPALGAENPDSPKGSRRRQKTKVLKTEEKSEVRIREETSKTVIGTVKREVKEEVEDQVKEVSPNKDKRKRKRQGEKQEKQREEAEELLAHEGTPKTTKRKRQTKQEKVEKEEEDEGGGEAIPKKVKRKRKTKEEKEAEAMPLAARTASLRMYIGAHVSSAKGSSWPYSCVAILVLRQYHISRSAQRGHKLCAYWVIFSSSAFIPISRLT